MVSPDDKLDDLLGRARWPGDQNDEVNAAVDRILSGLNDPTAGSKRIRPAASPIRNNHWKHWVVAFTPIALTVLLLFHFTGDNQPVEIRQTPVLKVTVKSHSKSVKEQPKDIIDQPADTPTVISEVAEDHTPSGDELVALVLEHAARRHFQQQKLSKRLPFSRWAETVRGWSSGLETRLLNAQKGPVLPALMPATCHNWEQSLWTLAAQRPKSRPYVASALGVVGSTRSVSALYWLLEDPQARSAAALSLLRLVPSDSIRQIVLRETRPSIRRTLIATLVRLPDPQATDLYLELVYDRQTRAEALSALQQVKRLQTDALVARLNGDDWNNARAAALVLGKASADSVTDALESQLMTQSTNPHLWLAIVSRPEPRVRRFLHHARHHRKWSLQVNQAEQVLANELSLPF